MNTQRCADHSTIADDWRTYADSALDMLEPLVERIRTQPPPAGAEAEPSSCANCPVCAVITVLRGGRSELAVRLADQFGDLLEALRTALAEGAGAAPPPSRPAPKAPGGHRGFRSPRVQHISVVRGDGGGAASGRAPSSAPDGDTDGAASGRAPGSAPDGDAGGPC